jgi:alkylation response protein AidB-like acyl-CoA dehydrogenase
LSLSPGLVHVVSYSRPRREVHHGLVTAVGTETELQACGSVWRSDDNSSQTPRNAVIYFATRGRRKPARGNADGKMHRVSTELPPRQTNYTLSEEQQALREAFASFFERECPSDLVRSAEPSGFDARLWARLADMRAVAMGLPEDAKGDGAGLVDLSLVAEECGRRVAPVPLVEAVVAARLLASGPTVSPEWMGDAASGSRLLTLALHPGGGAQLVPAAAVAGGVIGLLGDELVLTHSGARPEPVPNQGHAPIAWWDLEAAGERIVINSGPDAAARFHQARREWKLLMAACLVGMARATLDIGVEHARARVAFGAPIGTFQGVSHPLADVAGAVDTARRLVHKAAWFADHEPDANRQLIPMAYLYAEESAMRAAVVGVHVLGGVGFTVESDQQLYFRRVKGWTLVAGDPKATLAEIADEYFGPPAAVTS